VTWDSGAVLYPGIRLASEVSPLELLLGTYASTKQEHLKPLIKAGVKGFKCFLIESGVDVSIAVFALSSAREF